MVEPSHLDILKEAYDKVGIRYVIRKTDGGYSYLFVTGTDAGAQGLEVEDLDFLCRSESFIEFQHGQIASY